MNNKSYSQSQTYQEKNQSFCQKLAFWIQIVFYYLNIGSHVYLLVDVVNQMNFDKFNDEQASYWVYLFGALLVCMIIEKIKSYFLTFEFVKIQVNNSDMTQSYQSDSSTVEENNSLKNRIVSLFLSLIYMDFIFMKLTQKTSGQRRVLLRKETTHIYCEGILFSLVGVTLIQTKIVWDQEIPPSIITYTLISCIYCLYVVYNIQIDKIDNSLKFEKKWMTPFNSISLKTQKHITNPFTLGALTQNLEKNIIYPELFTINFLQHNKLLPQQQYETKKKLELQKKKLQEERKQMEEQKKKAQLDELLKKDQKGKQLTKAQKLKLKKQENEEERKRIKKEKLIEQKLMMKQSQMMIEESNFMYENKVNLPMYQKIYILFNISSHLIGFGILLVMQIMTTSTIDFNLMLVIGFLLYIPKFMLHINVIFKNKEEEGLLLPLGWFILNIPYLPLYGLVQIFAPVKSDKIPFIQSTSETWAHNFLPSIYVSTIKELFQIFWLFTVKEVIFDSINYDELYIPDINLLQDNNSGIKTLYEIALACVIFNSILYFFLLVDQIGFYVKLKKNEDLKSLIYERNLLLNPDYEKIDQKYKEDQERKKEKEKQEQKDVIKDNNENKENKDNNENNNNNDNKDQQVIQINDQKQENNENQENKEKEFDPFEQSLQEVPSENIQQQENNEKVQSQINIVLAPDSQRVQLIKSQQRDIQQLFSHTNL